MLLNPTSQSLRCRYIKPLVYLLAIGSLVQEYITIFLNRHYRFVSREISGF